MTTQANILISLTVIFLVLFVVMIIVLIFNIFSFEYVNEPIINTVLRQYGNISQASDNNKSFSNETTITYDLVFTPRDRASVLVIIVLIVICTMLFWLINTLLRVTGSND